MLKPTCRQPLPEAAAPFRAALHAWFSRQGKDYPWRRTHDPYAVLVSEVMLQQTQIATVLGRGFYTRFLERFPDLATLAAAEDEPLLKAWEGLGYYRRARMLREAARAIVQQHGGLFPTGHAGILALPGVGRYTAGAVVSFAYDQPAPIVDGNVARVLSRLFDLDDPVDLPAMQRWLWQTAETLLDREHPRIFNSALMELGQTVCRPGVPDCLSCPVAVHCQTRTPEVLPKKAKKATIEEIEEHAIVSLHQGRILLRQLGKGRREGMWRLPERSAEALAQAGLQPAVRRKYGITRYRVTLHLYQLPVGHPLGEAIDGETWRLLEEIPALVLPPADRAALTAVLAAS